MTSARRVLALLVVALVLLAALPATASARPSNTSGGPGSSLDARAGLYPSSGICSSHDHLRRHAGSAATSDKEHTYFVAGRDVGGSGWVHNGRRGVGLGMFVPAFWRMIEKKGIRHLGYRMLGASRIQNALAKGDRLFRNAFTDEQIFARTLAYLRGRVRSIHFELSGLAQTTRTSVAGRFARQELADILHNPDLFAKARFYEEGVRLRMPPTELREHLLRRFGDILPVASNFRPPGF